MNVIIGKTYELNDNSYAVCVNDGTNHYLAGTRIVPYKRQTVIVTEPFACYVKSSTGKIKIENFIQVRCSKTLIHTVMYRKEWVI